MKISHTETIESLEKYILIRNKKTGEEAVIDCAMSYYKRISQGFLNKLRMKPYFVKHIVLTQAKESYKPKIINNFCNQMRRRYKDIVYIWTVEEQERGVLHWHFIVAFDFDISFGSKDVKKIQAYWKYGIIEVVPVRNVSMGYLLKYVNKSLSVGLRLHDRVRRIGTTRIEPWLKQSWAKLQKAIDAFIAWGQSIANFSDYYWSRGRAFLYTGYYTYSTLVRGDTWRHYKEKIWIYRPDTDWYKISEFMGLPS